MIKINLLPPETQGKGAKRTSGAGATAAMGGGESAMPALITALVAVVLFASAGAGGYFVYGKIAESNDDVDYLQRKLKKSKDIYEQKVDKYKEQYRNWERWKDQEEILQVLMPEDRILWSRKINMISNAVPAGVFITEIVVDEDVRMVETQRSIKRRKDYEDRKAKLMAEYENDNNKVQAQLGPVPEEVKKPEITQTLTISAVSTGETSNDRFDRMLAFQRSLESYEMKGMKGESRRFMDGFKSEIDFGKMEATDLDGVAVWSFQFRLTTKPMFDAEE